MKLGLPSPLAARCLLGSVLLLGCSSAASPAETADAGRGLDASSHDAHLHADAPTDAGAEGGAHADSNLLPDVFVPARPAGERIPLSAACDPVDPIRCLLPWPNNTFTLVDKTTATGLRLAVHATSVAMNDDPTSINRADGFSRVSPIVTAFSGAIDPATLGDLTTGGLRVIVQQPGATFGQLVPMRFDLVNNGDAIHPQSMIVAYTRVPLAPATDYAVVVTDAVRTTDGKRLAPDRNASVALALAAPETDVEGALLAYDAPAREAMKAAGIDPRHGVRVWDFTTRSLADPTSDLLAMRAAEIAAFDGTTAVGITIDTVASGTMPSIALVVEGRITGLPSYLTSTGSLSRSAAGDPTPAGVHDAPFRVALPAGTGDYRVVMYGHGTGGNYHDAAFDAQITSAGAAKVGMQFIGWTDTSILPTFESLARLLVGTEISTAGLMQSVADGMVIQHGLATRLGDTLAGMTVNGVSNPMFGRRPNLNLPVWAGGSLGGTMGFVYASIEPTIVAAVLNVPGAAWTHFVPYSSLFKVERLVLGPNYPTDIDIFLGIATTQTNWDPIDGAAWYDAVGEHHPILLEQESIGDPVLPNIGDEMVAAASHADQVGVVLAPIATCSDVSEATGHSGITQFKVPTSVTDPYKIHGFAANSSPAGVAAQQQIQSFIQSVWAGAPTISVPPGCVANTPSGSCDFSGS